MKKISKRRGLNESDSIKVVTSSATIVQSRYVFEYSGKMDWNIITAILSRRHSKFRVAGWYLTSNGICFF